MRKWDNNDKNVLMDGLGISIENFKNNKIVSLTFNLYASHIIISDRSS